MTPEEALDALTSNDTGLEKYGRALNVLRELVDGAPEIVCPKCDARIRARMADQGPQTSRVTCRACGHANRVVSISEADHVETWEHPVIGSGETAGGNPAARMVLESYRDYADRLYGMYRALLVDVERLREVERAARDRVTYDPADKADQALIQALDRR